MITVRYKLLFAKSPKRREYHIKSFSGETMTEVADKLSAHVVEKSRDFWFVQEVKLLEKEESKKR